MDTIKKKIEELILLSLEKCESWVQKGVDGLDYFVDPNDGVEISAHYGATHAAASFIIWGKMTNNEIIFDKGVSLLRSIIKRWDKSKMLTAFHYDFNNMALVLVADLVDDELREQIMTTILLSSDSKHDTINWLPMRWAVNRSREEWTGNRIYNDRIKRCKRLIEAATNLDGGVEDRLPNGLSFNLQYNVATVAILQYLRLEGEDIDISKELGFLLSCVAPDGDINYLGRGTNQVFAWGLWIYLLSSSFQIDELHTAVGYLAAYLPSMLQHNNIMLNDWNGTEKYLWWDYHYCSVYTAHCLLWLILAYRDLGKSSVTPIFPSSTETGVHIYRSENAFLAWFEGRKEYLSERGPLIAALWTKKQGMIFKGTFGPWKGYFGNDYIYEDVVVKNFLGLLKVKTEFDWTKIPYVHRVFEKTKSDSLLYYKPVFKPFAIKETDDKLIIDFLLQKEEVYANVPIFNDSINIECLVDGSRLELSRCQSIKNQYQWVHLCQSRKICANHMVFIID